MAGIWQYKNLPVKGIPEHLRFSLGEGSTPLLDLDFQEYKLKIKNENVNPTGSFKDRSLAYQISYHSAKGVKKFTLSSSGNAAISAAAYCAKAQVELDLFVSSRIIPQKLEKIENYVNKKIRLHQSLRPKSDAIKFSKYSGSMDIRGSIDDIAVFGYQTIAYELTEQYPEIDAIFIPCSSGTSALGIAKGFAEMKKVVRIFLCQTAKVNAIAKVYDQNFNISDFSLADAIVDRVAVRKKQLTDIINLVKGGAFVIEDNLLKETKELLKNSLVKDLTYNSLLGLAAVLKSKKFAQNLEISHPVILASGT